MGEGIGHLEDKELTHKRSRGRPSAPYNLRSDAARGLVIVNQVLLAYPDIGTEPQRVLRRVMGYLCEVWRKENKVPTKRFYVPDIGGPI